MGGRKMQNNITSGENWRLSVEKRLGWLNGVVVLHSALILGNVAALIKLGMVLIKL